jgi:hypothetical protein
MFGKQIRLRPFLGGIVVTAAIAVVGVPSALASTSAPVGTSTTPPDPSQNTGSASAALQGYTTSGPGVTQAQPQGYRFITDTLGGNGHSVQASQLQPNRFTSDTIADANPYSTSAYVHGGASPTLARAIQHLGFGRSQAPVVNQGTGPYIGTLPPGYTLGGSAPAALTAHGYNTNAYVPGGTTPSEAEQIQNSGWNHTPVPTGQSSGNSSNWRDIGIVAVGALLLVLLLGALRAGRDNPNVRTA